MCYNYGLDSCNLEPRWRPNYNRPKMLKFILGVAALTTSQCEGYLFFDYLILIFKKPKLRVTIINGGKRVSLTVTPVRFNSFIFLFTRSVIL